MAALPALAVSVRRGAAMAIGQLGRLAGGDRIGRQRQAGPVDTARPGGRRCSAGGTANRRPRFARPSLIRHSGVLMSRIEASRRPSRSTRSASFQACSRWWPGYVSWAMIRGRVGGPDGQVRVDVDPRPAPAVEPVVGAPRLPAHEARRAGPRPSGRPNVAAARGAKAVDQPVHDRRQPIERDLEAPVPGGEPVAQRRVAGQERVDPRGGLLEHASSGRRAGAMVEAARDELQVRQRRRRRGRPPASRARRAGRRASRAGRDRRPRPAAGRAAPARRRAIGPAARSCSRSTWAFRSAGPK